MAVLAFAGALLLGAAPAWAHPYLVQTLPGPGAILSQPPPTIEIGFTERLVLEGSSLQLLDPEAQPAALGPLHKPKTGLGLGADVKGGLHSAVYRVKWAVLGDDGHSSSGDFRFGLAAPDGKAPPDAEQLSVRGGPGAQSQAYESPIRVALRWAGSSGPACSSAGRCSSPASGTGWIPMPTQPSRPGGGRSAGWDGCWPPPARSPPSSSPPGRCSAREDQRNEKSR